MTPSTPMDTPSISRTTLDIPMPKGAKEPGSRALRRLVESALFHYWNCDGQCGKMDDAMARLAAAVDYESYPGQAEEIAQRVIPTVVTGNGEALDG